MTNFPFRYGAAICCCPCDTWVDYFAYLTTVLPPNLWQQVPTEDPPTWTVDAVNHRLVEAGNAGVMCIATWFVGHETMSVGVQTYAETTGNKFRMILNYVDENSYHYVQLEIAGTNGDASILSLHRVSGGSATTLDSMTVDLSSSGTTRQLGACLSNTILSGSIAIGAADLCLWAQTTPHEDGHRAGLGNGSAQQITFDNFAVFQQKDWNRECDDCCPCKCKRKYIPDELTATYVGDEDCDCGGLTGITVTLSAGHTNTEWSGTISGGDLDGLKLTLTCLEDPEDVTTWLLTFDPSGVTDDDGKWCGSDTTWYSDASTDCGESSLDIVFEIDMLPHNSYLCPEALWDCGRQGPALPPPDYCTKYTIHITE